VGIKNVNTSTGNGVKPGVKNGGHVVCFVIAAAAAAVAGNRQRGDGCGGPREISKTEENARVTGARDLCVLTTVVNN